MSTIAELGIAVNSGEAVKATSDLENLAQAGAKAEKAADGVSAGFDKAATATADLSASERKLSETLDEAKARLLATAKASLESSEYYQRLTTSVNTNASAMESSGSSVSSLASLQRRLQAESDALVGSTDRQAEATKKAAAATGVQAEGLQELLGKLNPTMAALDKLDQQQAQLQKYKAAGVIDADTFREYSTRIDASRQKLGEFDEGLRKTGISSGQTQAALRQLPAQFTDIFTSLAGGQNPLMVLIQQGGQIKDSFGGIGPTMDALKDKFRSLFSGGAGAAVLGESLAGIASGAKDTAENAGEAGESLSDLAEGSNTAAEAAENAQKAYGALPPAVTGASMSILGMVAAVAAVAAVLGTVIYGYSQGSQEAGEYNKALILTGNYAGTSADQLASLARQVSATNGTTGEAAASLAKLAGSGAVAGESFGMIAEAAAAMEDATGKSVDATIAEFIKIAKDPVAAAKELNDQYNFLTASVYSQIVALKEQGDTVGAADLLTKAYAETIQTRSGEITQNLGLIERAWKGIKEAAAGALDATLNAGRALTMEEQAQAIRDRLATNQGKGGRLQGLGAETRNTKKDQADLTLLELQIEAEKSKTGYLGEQARIQKEGIAAEQRLKQISDSNLTNAEKRGKLTEEYLRYVKQLKEANPDSPFVKDDYVAKTLQNIKDKNKDPKGTSAGPVDLTVFNDAQNALRGIQDEYANTLRQLDAAQKAGLISQADYATQRAVLIRAEKDEVTAGYQAEISALEAAQGKKATTAEQSIQLDQKIADARAGMVKAQKDADSQLEVLAIAEKGRLDKQSLNIKRYVDALGEQQKALELAGQRAVIGVGQGDRQNALSGELNGQQDTYAKQVRDLESQQSDPSRKMDPEEFARKSQALADANKKATDQIRQNYADVEAAQRDWTKGASAAWENYLDSAQNVAGQTKALFSNAFSSMEDAIVNFAMTGKLSFADFTKSILADMARIAARQAASGLLSSLAGLGASALGAYFGGGSAPSSAGSTAAGYSPEVLAGWSGVTQANGGAWSGGVQMFADGGAFTNSVVSKPTAFGMAGGKKGIMGEAGDEAIMPLARTSSGKLGVMAMGGGGAGSTQINVEVHIDGDGNASSSADAPGYDLFGKELATFVEQKYQELRSRDMRQGGVINKAIKGR
ncbi:phage tail tape measure protein, lambda family [Pseudomonas synxantha]|uniref:Phage tail tape measure protein lambda n=1 Tax=Pseudomonas synxantha TaxID=47883 RepID=A0AAX3I4X1_9PSED|nr:phage tail tape measure protein [Pseudomonas synxantha]KRP51534.1 tail protein [Pseudomonas synxantha]SDU19522.1 phage tail tape measure protein, lambda family [Pseudomonas synxantha]VTQ97793.1 Phage tail tape measure protein lambda [Pseudomonas synxantha]